MHSRSDATYLGFSIEVICIFLSVITGVLSWFSCFFFLPIIWGFPLSIYAAVTAGFGVLAAVTRSSSFSTLYMITEGLCNVPVATALVLTIRIMVKYDSESTFINIGCVLSFLSFVPSILAIAFFRKMRQSFIASAGEQNADDYSKYLGISVKNSCVALSLITGACTCFSVYFLPKTWNYVFMAFAAGSALIGAMTAVVGSRSFCIAYLITESVCRLAAAFALTFIIAALFTYMFDTGSDYNDWDCYDLGGDYLCHLVHMDHGFLIFGCVVACVSFIFALATMAGFRKLRKHQKRMGTTEHQQSSSSAF